jgi:predicted nucleotidyltransferase
MDYEREILSYLKNYMSVAREVKEILKVIDPQVKVCVFGSVVKGNFTASSDIDILVITKAIERKDDMIVEVYRRIKAPVELHITSPDKFKSWYIKFIDINELVEV